MKFQSTLDDIVHHVCQHEHDAALTKIDDAIKEWPGNAALLLLRAEQVQLSNQPVNSESIVGTYNDAIALDPSGIDPLLECAYFIEKVQNDPALAAYMFQRAEEMARRFYIDALKGRIRTYRQLKMDDDADRVNYELTSVLWAERPPNV